MVLPDARAKVPAPEIVLVPQFNVPLLVPVKPERIEILDSSVITAPTLMLKASKAVAEVPPIVFPVPEKEYTCVPVELLMVPLFSKLAAKALVPVEELVIVP